MHGVLRRSGSVIQEDPEIDDSTLSRKSVEWHKLSSSPTAVYICCCKSHCSTDVTFIALEPSGLWRVLVLPQQYLYREIIWKSPQSNVNSLQVGLLLPFTSLLFGRLKIQRVTYIDSTLESISPSSSLHHEGPLSNLNEWNMLSITSGQNPITECEFPGTIFHRSDANSVEDMNIHDSKKERSTDKYSRKKPRKKGKRNRNLKFSNGLNELQSAVGCSITQAVIQNIQHRSICSDICNSLMNDAMTVSSISLGSSSDERCSQRGRKSPHRTARTEVSSNGDILISAKRDGPGQIEELSEKKRCSKQHVGNLYGTEKRDKYFRRVPKDSNVYASSTGNQNSRARKESCQCIWKRVQKSDADVSNCDSEKLNLAFSQFDDRLRKNTLKKKKFPNSVDSIVLSQSAHQNQEKLKVPKTPRRNKCPDSLQENEDQCRKGPPVNGACSNACLKTNMQSDGVFGSATEIATEKRSKNAADSQTSTSSFRARYKKRNLQYVPFKPISNHKACPRNLEAKENVPIVVSSVDDQMVEHQLLLSRSEKFNGLTEQQVLAADGEGDKMDKEVSPSSQTKHGLGAVPQAVSESWMHQEVKDSELSDCLSVGMLVEPERWASKNAMQEQLASKCLAPVSSSVNVRVLNAGQNVENIKALPGDTQFGKLRNYNTCTLEQGCNNAAMAKFFIPEAKSKIHSLENDWRNIARAVNDAHRAQLASKAIEIGKGYPAAEFEKLLYSASPIVCPSASIRAWQACFCSQATNAPLCRHEIPNVALENLWQWYEKHGSYGLEVKAEDHRSAARQCGIDCFEFRAYFVPYLSAIQLFKDHRTHPIHNDNRALGSMEVVNLKMNKISESSPNVELRLIYSVLVPQPLVEDSSSLLQKGGLSDSGSSSECSNGDLDHLPDEFKFSDDVELLFEYFECEQPQRRRPLFETIQELVSGNGPSNCRSYGDPSILHTVSLHDLHPHSWFSVAWYPIYRIPDGNLRAAFLTYHSLGHFIHREQTLKTCSPDACMVSPIVGLQSYNAQGECWFHPRHSADDLTDELLDRDLHTVLRERVRTLEQTASIMSRAVRKIGSDTLVNTHPDYEFFLSR